MTASESSALDDLSMHTVSGPLLSFDIPGLRTGPYDTDPKVFKPLLISDLAAFLELTIPLLQCCRRILNVFMKVFIIFPDGFSLLVLGD